MFATVSRNCACVSEFPVTRRRSPVRSANVFAVSATERVVAMRLSWICGLSASLRSESTLAFSDTAVEFSDASSVSTFTELVFAVTSSVWLRSSTF